MWTEIGHETATMLVEAGTCIQYWSGTTVWAYWPMRLSFTPTGHHEYCANHKPQFPVPKFRVKTE